MCVIFTHAAIIVSFSTQHPRRISISDGFSRIIHHLDVDCTGDERWKARRTFVIVLHHTSNIEWPDFRFYTTCVGCAVSVHYQLERSACFYFVSGGVDESEFEICEQSDDYLKTIHFHFLEQPIR